MRRGLRDRLVALVASPVAGVIDARQRDVDLVDLETQQRGEVLLLVALDVRGDTAAVLVVVLESFAVDQHLVGLGLHHHDVVVGGAACLEQESTQLFEELRLVGVGLGVHLSLEGLEALALFGLAALLALEFFLVASFDLADLALLLGLDGLALRVDLALLLRFGGGLLAGLALDLTLLGRDLGLGVALLLGLGRGDGFGLGGGGLLLGGGLGLGLALFQQFRGGGGFGLGGGDLLGGGGLLGGVQGGDLLTGLAGAFLAAGFFGAAFLARTFFTGFLGVARDASEWPSSPGPS